MNLFEIIYSSNLIQGSIQFPIWLLILSILTLSSYRKGVGYLLFVTEACFSNQFIHFFLILMSSFTNHFIYLFFFVKRYNLIVFSWHSGFFSWKLEGQLLEFLKMVLVKLYMQFQETLGPSKTISKGNKILHVLMGFCKRQRVYIYCQAFDMLIGIIPPIASRYKRKLSLCALAELFEKSALHPLMVRCAIKFSPSVFTVPKLSTVSSRTTAKIKQTKEETNYLEKQGLMRVITKI